MKTEYTELINQLKSAAISCPDEHKFEIGGLLYFAAAAIEALQAEVPKRGEWIIHGEPPMLVIECSVCGQKYFNHVMQEKAKYCSMCGAKMTEVRE